MFLILNTLEPTTATELPVGIHSCFHPQLCLLCLRIVEFPLDPWISKLLQPFVAKQGSVERHWLGISIHGSFEINQNSGAE